MMNLNLVGHIHSLVVIQTVYVVICSEFPHGGRDEPAAPSFGGNKPVRLENVDPQATRSLFVGNIPKNISVYDVRDSFQRYGTILVSNMIIMHTVLASSFLFSYSQDVEIKKMGGTATYGFVLYYDLSSAIVAKKYMDGQNLKGNNIRVRILVQCELHYMRLPQ